MQMLEPYIVPLIQPIGPYSHNHDHDHIIMNTQVDISGHWLGLLISALLDLADYILQVLVYDSVWEEEFII